MSLISDPVTTLAAGPALVVLYNVIQHKSLPAGGYAWLNNIVMPVVAGYAAGYSVARFFGVPIVLSGLVSAGAAYYVADTTSGQTLVDSVEVGAYATVESGNLKGALALGELSYRTGFHDLSAWDTTTSTTTL